MTEDTNDYLPWAIYSGWPVNQNDDFWDHVNTGNIPKKMIWVHRWDHEFAHLVVATDEEVLMPAYGIGFYNQGMWPKEELIIELEVIFLSGIFELRGEWLLGWFLQSEARFLAKENQISMHMLIKLAEQFSEKWTYEKFAAELKRKIDLLNSMPEVK